MVCPITMAMMTDPVICNDGNTYERTAIATWFEGHGGISPMTNCPISTDLVPNRALKDMIENYKNSQSKPMETSIQNVYDSEYFIKSSHFNIVGKDEGQFNHVKICLTLDVSYSMDESGGIPGDVETSAFTRLDVLKHACLCVIECLNASDELCLITFADSSQILLEPTFMNQSNKDKAKNLIKDIRTCGGTNLWGAIKSSIQFTQKWDSKDASVLILTDGEPTVGRTDVIDAMSNFCKEKIVSPRIHTFGISNQVKSNILYEVSNVYGRGNFHFVSDSSMLYTNVVNFMSNLRTYAGDIYVNDKFSGPIHRGYTIQLKGNPSDVIFVRYENADSYLQSPIKEDIDANYKFIYEFSNTLLESIKKIVSTGKGEEGFKLMEIFMESITDDNEFTLSMKVNIYDQVKLAMKNEYFNKWGKHYLLSLLSSVKNQMNTNFKDEMIQNFGGETFNVTKSQLDNIVEDVPPPPPSSRYNGRYGSGVSTGAGRSPPPLPASMSVFNVPSGPCFQGFNQAKMQDGTYKQVKDIEYGDYVWTPHGGSKIKYVIQTKCKGGIVELSNVNGLMVTPWHPIKYDDVWTFPKDISGSNIEVCSDIYSFVLEEHHIMQIGGYEVICLAHGFQEGILKHDFWGTNKVIEALKDKPGYNVHHVLLQTGCVKIDRETHLVCGFF